MLWVVFKCPSESFQRINNLHCVYLDTDFLKTFSSFVPETANHLVPGSHHQIKQLCLMK